MLVPELFKPNLFKFASFVLQFKNCVKVNNGIGSIIHVKYYASFSIKKFKLYKLKKGPSTKVELKRKDALKFYDQMVLIRRLEMMAYNIYLEKMIRGFLHLCNGQEACAVGMRAAMRDKDDVISAYRIHGFAYIMGATPKQILGELAGRKCGHQRGKGGSMHIYTKHFYGGNGIVGAQIPVGTGIAFANKYKKNGAVCFTMYGDGAANQGQCYESFNMAALWKLPCVFVCENNGYAMGTSVARSSALTASYKKGHYIPGVWVDGMDVLAVREGTRYCIEHVLKHGPIVMELATYRYHGHSMSDPGKSYRTREEVQEVRSTKDPINMFRKKILDAKLASKDELKAIDKKCTNIIKKAIDELRKEPVPGLEELAADVYSLTDVPVKSVLPWKPLKHIRIGKAVNFK